MEEKIYISLTDDVKDELLAEYERQPCLWDPAQKVYRDFSAIAVAKQAKALKFDWATGTCILLL